MCVVFVVSEKSEIITSRSVQNVIRNKNLYISKLNEGDYRVVTLFEVVHHPLNTTQLGCVLYSRIFKSLPGEPEPVLGVKIYNRVYHPYDRLYSLRRFVYPIQRYFSGD